MVHVGGQLFAGEFVVDLSKTGVRDAARGVDGVGGVVDAESPRARPPVAAGGLVNGW